MIFEWLPGIDGPIGDGSERSLEPWWQQLYFSCDVLWIWPSVMVDTPSKISSDDTRLSGTDDVRRRPRRPDDDPNGVNAIGVKWGNGETIISIGRLGRKNETLPENKTGIRTFSKTDSKYTWMIIFDKNFQKFRKI